MMMSSTYKNSSNGPALGMLDFFGRRVLATLEQSSQIVLDAQQEIGNVRWFNMAVRG